MATSTALWRPGYWLVLFSAALGVLRCASSIGQIAESASSLVAATADDSVEDPTSTEGESAPPSTEATHHQENAVIRPVTEGQSALKAFVVAPDGNIITLVQLSAPSEDDDDLEAAILSADEQAKPARGKGPLKPACEVRIFSPDGEHKRIAAWRVGFLGQTLAVGPDNRLYIAGSGRVGRYSLEGQELLVADSPQTVLVGNDQGACAKGPQRKSKCSRRPESRPSPRYSSSATRWPPAWRKWRIN